MTNLLEEIKKLPSKDKHTLLLEVFKGYDILELKEFVDLWCTTFGVSAIAAPVSVVAAAPKEEVVKPVDPTDFNVVLTSGGEKKINVIKVIRQITTLGLKEAKELVDTVPKTIKEKVSKEEAAKIKKEIEEAGGVVELKGIV